MTQIDRLVLICMNPKCRKSNQRCLDHPSIKRHPQQCMHHLYPIKQIIDSNWQRPKSYPNDAVGKSVHKKISQERQAPYIKSLIEEIKNKTYKLLETLQQVLNETYPQNELKQEFQQIYNLQRISSLLKRKQSSHQITKMINQNFHQSKFNRLVIINENYEMLESTLNTLFQKVKKQFQQITKKYQIIKSHGQLQSIDFQTLNYGLIKSKYAISNKIECQSGHVIFPKIQTIANFLPWVYTQFAFSSGIHEFKITSGKTPFNPNAGFSILQEQDIDVYPYLRYKSLFSKQGKNFDLIEGSPLQSFMTSTSIVKLILNLQNELSATISDSQKRCKYICQLQKNKKYRMGIYGNGWSVVVLQLT